MARIAFGVNAALAWVGVVLTAVISTVDGYARIAVEPGLYGGSPAGWPGAPMRLLDSLSYFTIWSNIVVAISATLLALQPARDSLPRRALRFSGLIMITITALVYAVWLSPYVVLSGWSYLTNPLAHIVVPAVTVLAWLVWGPRGRIGWRTLPASLLIPLAWVVYMLARGAIDGTYPYGFVNVAAHGYPKAFAVIAAIFAFGLLVAAVFAALDRGIVALTQPRDRAPSDAGLARPRRVVEE